MNEEVVIQRMDDRVKFLTVKKEWGNTSGVQIGSNEVSVLCWLNDLAEKTPITLSVRGGGFDLAQSMSSDEARMLAKALIAAADEADADPLDKAIEANGGRFTL